MKMPSISERTWKRLFMVALVVIAAKFILTALVHILLNTDLKFVGVMAVAMIATMRILLKRLGARRSGGDKTDSGSTPTSWWRGWKLLPENWTWLRSKNPAPQATKQGRPYVVVYRRTNEIGGFFAAAALWLLVLTGFIIFNPYCHELAASYLSRIFGTATIKNFLEQPARPSARVPSGTLLACGEGYHSLPNVHEVYLVVPPGNCWTEWQVRPKESMGFEWHAEGYVDILKAYTNGKEVRDFDQPLVWRPDSNYIARARFKNPGALPVRVRLHMN